MTKKMVEKLIEDILKTNNVRIEDVDLSLTYDYKGLMVATVRIIMGRYQRYTCEQVVSLLAMFIEMNKLKYIKPTLHMIKGKLIVDLHFKDVSLERVFQEVESEQIILDILNDKSTEIEIEQLMGKMNLLLEKLHIEANGEKRKVIENELKNVYRRLVELEYF